MNLRRAHFSAPKIAPIGLSDHACHRHRLPRECHVEEEKSCRRHRRLRHQSGGWRFARQHVCVRGEQEQPPSQSDVHARISENVSIYRVAIVGRTSLDRASAASADHDHDHHHDRSGHDHNCTSHDYHGCPHHDSRADNDGRSNHHDHRCTNDDGRSDNDHRCAHDHNRCARRVETASYSTWMGHQRGRGGRSERDAYRRVAV
jgi:hypothetical protein